jgi:hypothetical protein
LLGRQQDLDRARLARGTLDQTLFLQPDDHLVRGRWRHAKECLDIGFRRVLCCLLSTARKGESGHELDALLVESDGPCIMF